MESLTLAGEAPAKAATVPEMMGRKLTVSVEGTVMTEIG